MFDVEHAFGMYATGFCTFPAEGLYDQAALMPLMNIIDDCHIYLIGFVPRVRLDRARQEGDELFLDFTVLGKEHSIRYPLQDSMVLKQEGDHYYLEDSKGKLYWPDSNDAQRRLSDETGLITFQVKYIGQAYGQDGSRNALDRLLKHETLQRISLLGTPPDHRLTLLLLSIQPCNQLYTVFNPFAKEKDEDGKRMRDGLDKAYNTSEAERTAIFEASLIRYFYPEYNKAFKDSFPSTNLKVLKDCYEKDFSAVIAEICIEELPFRLTSEAVAPTVWHAAQHDLHVSEERKMFFGMQGAHA
jgi:hypothetical protein